jgi:hypothetical protein
MDICERAPETMSTRIREQTIIFKHPFSLGGIEQTQPSGTYMVEIEEELVPDLSFPVYRRIATVIYLARCQNGAVGGYEAATIDPLDLDAAIQKDAAL